MSEVQIKAVETVEADGSKVSQIDLSVPVEATGATELVSSLIDHIFPSVENSVPCTQVDEKRWGVLPIGHACFEDDLPTYFPKETRIVFVARSQVRMSICDIIVSHPSLPVLKTGDKIPTVKLAGLTHPAQPESNAVFEIVADE